MNVLAAVKFSGEIFSILLKLLSADGVDMKQVDALLDEAASMQDRKEGSPGYGNFRWYPSNDSVRDYNAVDFCMENGSVIAHEYLSRLAPPQRAKFDEILQLAIKGSLAHRVSDRYTNIAILNACNLILLGEATKNRDVFDEGVMRLDAFIRLTAFTGICEYLSPNYYFVDVDSLHRLHALVRDPAVKVKAERLLALFWTDLCVSSFPGARRLAGAHSRDYDYLYGIGSVPAFLVAAGVTERPGGASMQTWYLKDSWRPSAEILSLAAKTPREMSALWGDLPQETRTLWVGQHVALGTAGSNYWDMDIPLAVDFASKEKQARVYFIPDGRHDPYGRSKIQEGNGPHEKTLHLRPFWCAAQRATDALALVVYRTNDVPAYVRTLESHLVLPSTVDELRIGDKSMKLEPNRAMSRPLAVGDCLFLRQGRGAVAISVLWATSGDEAPPEILFVYDGDPSVPACRVTIRHALPGMEHSPPAAAFRVRVCDDAGVPAKFASFRRSFSQARAGARVDVTHIAVATQGASDKLLIDVPSPFVAPNRVVPTAPRAILSIDGRDLSATYFDDLLGIGEQRRQCALAEESMKAHPIAVPTNRDALWQAELGVVLPPFVSSSEGGVDYVVSPGGGGSVSYLLNVKKAGAYYLWGLISTPTPNNDSFYVTLRGGEWDDALARGSTILHHVYWPARCTRGPWMWDCFPEVLHLPAGASVLTIHAREPNARIDQLAITSERKEPQK